MWLDFAGEKVGEVNGLGKKGLGDGGKMWPVEEQPAGLSEGPGHSCWLLPLSLCTHQQLLLDLSCLDVCVGDLCFRKTAARCLSTYTNFCFENVFIVLERQSRKGTEGVTAIFGHGSSRRWLSWLRLGGPRASSSPPRACKVPSTWALPAHLARWIGSGATGV